VDAVTYVLAPAQPAQLRDSAWLNEELASLWKRHFADVSHANRVEIRFAASWKTRLGMISLSSDRQTSNISINGLLRLPEAPVYIARITIAHELVHYAHGFGSPLPTRHRHPHRGRIVERELRGRGLGAEYEVYQAWIRNHWWDFYDQVALNSAVVRPSRERGRTHEGYESQ
jgi:hypothetical protein